MYGVWLPEEEEEKKKKWVSKLNNKRESSTIKDLPQNTIILHISTQKEETGAAWH